MHGCGCWDIRHSDFLRNGIGDGRKRHQSALHGGGVFPRLPVAELLIVWESLECLISHTMHPVHSRTEHSIAKKRLWGLRWSNVEKYSYRDLCSDIRISWYFVLHTAIPRHDVGERCCWAMEGESAPFAYVANNPHKIFRYPNVWYIFPVGIFFYPHT